MYCGSGSTNSKNIPMLYVKLSFGSFMVQKKNVDKLPWQGSDDALFQLFRLYINAGVSFLWTFWIDAFGGLIECFLIIYVNYQVLREWKSLFYILLSFVYCIILHPVTARVYSPNLIQNTHSLPNPYEVLAAGNRCLVPQNSAKDYDNKLREKTCDQQNSLFCPVYRMHVPVKAYKM